MSAVSPHEDERKCKDDAGGDAVEEEFSRVFGDSAKEVVDQEERGEVGHYAARARARKTEAGPSQRDAQARNLDHVVFRIWCPHCEKGRTESYGHVKKV